MRSTPTRHRAAPPKAVSMSNVGELRRSGGVEHWEDVAAAEAVRATRERWLPVLEELLARWLKRPDGDLREAADLHSEIRRLRRGLGIGPLPDEVREQIRLRAKQHRARRRAS